MTSPVTYNRHADDDEILSIIADAINSLDSPPVVTAPLIMDMNIHELGLDSLKLLEMIGSIEDRIVRTFSEDELARVVTIRDIVALIRTRTNWRP
jgi:acyl carrier protein